MNREIFRLAIPNILSNISVPLLSTVDTALMGRFSEVHLGAVGLGSMIFNFVYWNFGFLRMGTTGLTAQAYGREDRGESFLTLSRALVIALLLAFLIIALQWPFREASLELMQVDAGARDLVAEYFNIRIWAAPATLCLYALFGWYFGMQNAIYPLILTILINGINILVSYLMVFEYQMEIAGVAWGTVIAQYAGLLLAIAFLLYKYRDFASTFSRQALLQFAPFARFLRINRDIFLRTLFLTFAFGFFYSQSSSLGEMALAANVILLQFLNWMSYGIDGFAYAAESLVGKYFGREDKPGLRKAISLSFIWSGVLAVMVSLTYVFFGPQLLRIFTDQADVINAAMPLLFWMALMPIAGTACYIWDGIYIGLTASKAMRDTMALSFIFYIGGYFLFTPLMGNHGLWLALLVFLFMRGMIQTAFFWKKGFSLK